MKMAIQILMLMLLTVVGLKAVPALGQPFDETTISFSIADDNILMDPGETRRNSPAVYIGGQASAAERDGSSIYNQTASRLVLKKTLDTGQLFPEGALRLRLAVNSEGDYTFADDGTYLALNWAPKDKYLLKLTMFPVDSDRFRLGYHYDITWGGTGTFPKNFTKGLVPGLRLAFQMPVFEAFIGMKTALVRSPAEDILDNPGGNTNQFVERTFYGALGGLGVEPVKGLRIMAQGGYFAKGTSTRADVLGKRVHSGGMSFIAAYHIGGEVGRRLDLRMYYEDPEKYSIKPMKASSSDFGFDIAIEYSRLIQTLEDPDHFGSTTNEWSNAFAFSAGMRLDKLRIHFDSIYRDLSYIVWNVPGFVPNQALPGSADLGHGGPFAFLPESMGGEIYLLLSTDYHFELKGAHSLTPAVSFGFLLPATYTPSATGGVGQGPAAEEHAQGIQTTVVRGSSSGAWDTLPVGEEELPVFTLKFDLRYSISQAFSLIAEASYANDPNYSQVEIDPHGHATRVYIDPNIVGLGIVSELSF